MLPRVPITEANCGSPQRLFGRAALDPHTGCWVWTGYINDDGYARVYRGTGAAKVKIYAHRVAFYHHYGYAPDVIDHLCRNRACINPDHLEDVDTRVNIARGVGPTAQRIWLDGVCVNGHVLAEVGIYICGKKKSCAQCARDGAARYRLRGRVA